MTGARISGWGSALPEKIVTNTDLEATLDTYMALLSPPHEGG